MVSVGSHLKKELNRVVMFAESLGLKVLFVSGKNKDYVGCYMEPEKKTPGVIEVCRSKKTTVTFQILTLLHEIGHHVDYTDKGSMPRAVRFLDQPNAPKWARRAIYNAERRGAAHGEQLYWTLMLRIPFWKVKKAFATDLYLYRKYFLTGEYPTWNETRKFRRRWNKRYKKLLAVR